MRRQYLVAALSLLMLVAVVATGIHVLNKEARANVNYVVFLYKWDAAAEDWTEAVNFSVQFKFTEAEGWLNRTTDANGKAFVSRDDWLAGNWQFNVSEAGGWQWYPDGDIEDDPENFPVLTGGANNSISVFISN